MAGSLKLPKNPIAARVSGLSQTPAVRDCLASFAKDKTWISEQHLQLCRIPAPTFLEQKRAEWMVERFRLLGCQARIDRGGNVIAHLGPEPKPPFVALTAHLDTVLAPRTPDDILAEPDGTLKGPGVSDNGAGLAALLALAKSIRACDSMEGSESLLFVANVGEEGEGNLSGMRYLCRQSSLAGQFSSFLVLDGPTTDHITRQALASRRFEVSFQGSGGHSWSDFGIGNPVHALSRAITFFTDNYADLSPNGTPRTSFNFGIVDGGSSINSIPTHARTKVDIRSESGTRIDELAEILTVSVEKALQFENEHARTGRLTARIKEIGSRPAGRVADSSPILSIVRAVDTHLGIRSHLDCASTDANIPLSMNLPAVSIGAGGQGGGAHTPQEWYRPDGRELGLRRILLILTMLLRE